MVQPKYDPKESLERIKLMMSYDMSKTLNENKQTISEQVGVSKVAGIASNISDILSGDVETEDLDELSQLLSSEVFGQKLEDGSCVMQKVMDYYSKSGIFGTRGGGIFGSGDLVTDITNADEIGEPEFEDVKKELINKINNEISRFCKGSKSDGEVKKSKIGGVGFTPCTGTYKKGCKSEAIRKVQGCLGGLVTDGKFGPNTERELKSKFPQFASSFTDKDVDTICGKVEPVKKVDTATNVDAENPADILGS